MDTHPSCPPQPVDTAPEDPTLGVHPYVAAVASAAPTPGGGSVAGVVGALAAALAEMVCRLSLGRAGSDGAEFEITAALARLTSAREMLLAYAAEDEAAYRAYRAAASLPRDTRDDKDARREAMQAALLAAALVPLATARASLAMMVDIELIAAKGNPHVHSDAVIAALLAEVAVRSSAVNVRVNTAMLWDTGRANQLDREIDELSKRAKLVRSHIA